MYREGLAGEEITQTTCFNPYLNDGRKFEPSLKSLQNALIEGRNFEPSFRSAEIGQCLTVFFFRRTLA